MKQKSSKIILAIETSCDDTGIALLRVRENKTGTKFEILANEISSQTELHNQYGGVFPAMAKREHARNIVPLFVHALKKTKLLKPLKNKAEVRRGLTSTEKLLEREPEMFAALVDFLNAYEMPPIDQIVVTNGPGLEPTLWVGINFARALGELFKIPVIPANHMEGHILSVAIPEKKSFVVSKKTFNFPMLALLVSGGHTELVLVKNIGDYKLIGETRDDAAGEAFDKIARMLELPYPGGPEISKLAKEVRSSKNSKNTFKFPRPMIHSKDFDFSFSGLKTAALYTIRDMKKISKKDKEFLALETENAIVEVLVAKTIRASQTYKVKTVVVGGGVAANQHLRKELNLQAKKLNIPVHFPTPTLSRDNALMIALAGYFKAKRIKKSFRTIQAEGSLSL